MVPIMAIPVDRFATRKPLQGRPQGISRYDATSTDLDHPGRKRAIRDNDPAAEDLARHIGGEHRSAVRGYACDRLFLIGGNSLQIILLQSRTRKSVNAAVALTRLLGASRLSDIARVIEDAASVELIDWEAETRLPATIQDYLGRDATKTSADDRKTVMVTGTTSFVGIFASTAGQSR